MYLSTPLASLPSLISLLFLLISAATLTMTASELTLKFRPVQASEVPCAPCQVDRLPYATFRRRFVTSCYQCGIAYGSSIEHCCMCHEAFTRECFRLARK